MEPRTEGRSHRPANHTRRRRRPGEAWDLWQVRLKGTVPRGDRVTTRAATPIPIVFVRRVCPKSLKLALQVRDTGQIRSAAAMDLRGRSLSGEGAPLLPRSLYRSLLLPVDSRGRVIPSDRTFAAGQYLRPTQIGDGVCAFILLTHEGRKDWEKVRPFLIKKPQTAPPIAPKPASVENHEAVTVAAG